jgi:hypothetical protein
MRVGPIAWLLSASLLAGLVAGAQAADDEWGRSSEGRPIRWR